MTDDCIIFTVGHSILALEDFLALLAAHRIEAIADVRRYPTSRRHPYVSGAALAPALAAEGIAYHWFEELGGRRSTKDLSEDNAGWRVAAFHAYADYTREPRFAETLGRLETVAHGARTAVMCAEAMWTKCHRRLIADALAARGWSVHHLMTRTRVEPHRIPDFARIHGTVVLYPAPA
ncbi:MAG: DUF488 domain-containing protein, partial [Planctomycetes bacterium]|nr:DUF488 domain-containing protein [Planctomycetota bacterium]